MKKDVFDKPKIIEGRTRFILKDHIDTQMIFPDKYIAVNDFNDIGQYTFNGLDGYENFAQEAEPGDIIITHENFGCGIFRQQAIDCFISLGVQAIIAKSFCETYKNSAINAGFPIMIYENLNSLNLDNYDKIRVNFVKGTITNLRNHKIVQIHPFTEKQLNIYLHDEDY